MSSSDEEILDLIFEQRRPKAGFSRLLKMYQEPIYWHVRRMVGNHEDANDVVQNCLMKVYRGLDRFERRSNLYTWIYRIATNEALTFLKSRKRHAVVDSLDEPNTGSERLAGGLGFDIEKAQTLLASALEHLPEKQRLVFSMRYFDELSYRDISRDLGTSEGALKASYHHAVKKIEAYVRAQDIF